MKEIEIGTGRELIKGDSIAILSIGHIGNEALKAAESLKEEGIEVGVYDMRFAKPLDEKLLSKIFKNYKHIITVEDGCIQGGFGSAVLEFMASKGFSATVKLLGIPDKIVEHGTQPELYRECGYDAQAIVEACKEYVSTAVNI